MKKIFGLFICLIVTTMVFSQESEALKKEWQNLHASKKEALEKFNESKFGMFIHWGVYTIPAGIWKGEKIPRLGEWIMNVARIPRAEYKQLLKQFNPTNFNAEEWVNLANDAGMKYIVAMPKHHDGFAMYKSEVTKYNIIDATPFDRDPIDELYKECKKQGIRFGIYYSHSVDWMDGGDAGVADERKLYPGEEIEKAYRINDWDPADVSFHEYLETKSKPQVTELLKKYPDLIEIWFDTPGSMTEKQSFEFYKLAYSLQPECVINSRVGNDFGDFWIPGDNKIPSGDQLKSGIYWETPGTLNNTWGYKSYDIDWKSVEEILFWLVEISSKGGNYLLNVGPKSDGTIPQESIDGLKKIGQWVKINGEAIYGTKSWVINKEGPTSLNMAGTSHREKVGFNNKFTPEDFWFTTKDSLVYVISLNWPTKNKALINSLGNYQKEIKSITMLGYKEKIQWEEADNKISVNLPVDKKPNQYGYVLKVELKTK